MKYELLFVLGFIVLGWAVFAATPAAATTAAGPYYASPAWDQTLQCDTQATCPRFITLSNFTETQLDPNGHKIIVSGVAVLDRETGLVWEQSPSASFIPWVNAQTHCNALATGNRLGWRLPTIQELASLVDPTQPSPALPGGHPFSNVQQSAGYWSATTYSNDATLAWHLGFGDGAVGFGDKLTGRHAWCVRGGQGGDPQ